MNELQSSSTSHSVHERATTQFKERREGAVRESDEERRAAGLEAVMDAMLVPVPTPEGMTSREIVRRAIEFDRPPRVPYSFMRPLLSDFFESAVLPVFGGPQRAVAKPPDAQLGDVYHDEWGVGWEVTTRSWDHAIEFPLADLSALDRYEFPDVAAAERYDWMTPHLAHAREAGKYVVAFDSIKLFELVRSLLGFEETMLAPYTQPEAYDELLGRLTDLTIEVMDHFARSGAVDGFMTWQDFGLQTTLQMKPETFRKVYLPHYARVVDAAHERGMQYIWHNCGQILDMLPDMIEIGTDVVQLDQPRLMGHDVLAERFGGKICFWNTVDIQWSAATAGVSADAIRREIQEMIERLQSASKEAVAAMDRPSASTSKPARSYSRDGGASGVVPEEMRCAAPAVALGSTQKMTGFPVKTAEEFSKEAQVPLAPPADSLSRKFYLLAHCLKSGRGALNHIMATLTVEGRLPAPNQIETLLALDDLQQLPPAPAAAGAGVDAESHDLTGDEEDDCDMPRMYSDGEDGDDNHGPGGDATRSGRHPTRRATTGEVCSGWGTSRHPDH